MLKISMGKNVVNYDWVHLLNEYRKVVNKNSVVLEIGSSVPERTSQLARQCGKLIGVELIECRLPANFENAEFIQADWQKLSDFIPRNSIDIAISSHVIEHVPNDVAAINELYAVLKFGGVALLNTPHRKRLVRSIVEFFAGERKFPYWEHIREYTEAEIKNLLCKSSFKKYEITPLVFGIHGGPVHIYTEQARGIFRRYCNYFEIKLYK